MPDTDEWFGLTPTPRPWGEELFWHDQSETCTGCGATIHWEADCQFWWVVYGYGNPPPGTFTCPSGARHSAPPEAEGVAQVSAP